MLLCLILSCTERYDFVVKDGTQGIVIEGFISNKSYANTLTYPADGRYFSVKLSQTSDVVNIRGEYILGADVKLLADTGESWKYTESSTSPGLYYLLDDSFAAQYSVNYQLNITTSDGDNFTSQWETMPSESTEVGIISIEETTKERYVFIAENETVLKAFNGINLNVRIPKNNEGNEKYYRWSYDPLWVYIAPEAGVASPDRTCWIRTPNYIGGYNLQNEKVGGYDKELIFIQTIDNHRTFEYFSILITQSEMSEGYYYFWKDLLAQSDKGGLYDQPPFNLPTNFTATNNDRNVNGYFGVVTENAYRWTLDKSQLSYEIKDNIAELCLIDYGPPAPGELDECMSCRGYNHGTPVTIPPWWW